MHAWCVKRNLWAIAWKGQRGPRFLNSITSIEPYIHENFFYHKYQYQDNIFPSTLCLHVTFIYYIVYKGRWWNDSNRWQYVYQYDKLFIDIAIEVAVDFDTGTCSNVPAMNASMTSSMLLAEHVSVTSGCNQFALHQNGSFSSSWHIYDNAKYHTRYVSISHSPMRYVR